MRGVDVVFHQAALRITRCADEPQLAVDVLVHGTQSVLDAAVRAGVRKVVAASSASVYGMAERFPTPEDQHPYNNDTLYGAAKAFNEGLLRSYHAMYGLDYVALRYFNVYGPRMDVHGVYTEVLVRWMERIADGRPPLILGDGRQTMDFVHVGDVARANVLAATRDATDEVFNVASGTETSLAELARVAARRDGRRAARRARPGARGQQRRAPPGGHPRGPSEGSGSRAQIGLDEGLRGLVAVVARRARGAGGRHGRDPDHAALARAGGGAGRRPRCSPRAGSRRARRSPPSRRRVCAALGAAHGVATTSCTTALHLALHALGVGPGDEVVVPSLSFIATANAPRYVGARPVFADVDLATQNVTAETVERALAPATRAVIAVHQAGMPADVERDRGALRDRA